jgi:Helicase associated domain
MTTLDGFGFNANTMAHDVSEDENEDNFADVSNILHHLNKDDFNEDSFPMISNDLSLSSLDFSMEDNSLEPTPIRPDGILSVTTHNAACIPSHGSTTITTTPNSEYPSTSLLSLSTKRDFSSLMLGVSSSCNPNVAPERNAFAIPSCNDRESCYIRPTKIAQMVSSNSFARSALDGRNHFGIRPEYQVSSTPPRSSGISKVAASHLGVSVHSTGDRWTSNNKSKSHPANQSSSQSPSKDANSNSDDEAARFRTYQSDQWKERFEELKAYKETFGHCVVPHNYLHNGSPALVSCQGFHHILVC